MNRLVLLSLSGGLAALIAGCPIYDDSADPLCDPAFEDCGPGPGGGFECTAPTDCGINETCGSDNQCHPGDCTFWGCVAGYACLVGEDGTAKCEPGGNTGGQGSGGNGSGGSGGDPNTYCGNPDDCGEDETCAPDGTCQPGDCTETGCVNGYACDPTTMSCLPENPAACGEDDDCAELGTGYKCVSGTCTAPEDQCFDGTQCGAGQVCADGKCTDACEDDGDCSPSWSCDTDKGICSVPKQPCEITSDCGSADLVCVAGACVPKAPNGECEDGFVPVENGCIPDQSPNFVCDVDGTQDACAAGSICLHHSCYISCEVPNQNACSALPDFDQCKSVTTPSGAHAVCGSSENLGGECDPTSGVECPVGSVCIDGFCK